MNEYGYNDYRNYLMHFNPFHDRLGRFASGPGSSGGFYVAGSKNAAKFFENRTKANAYGEAYTKQKIKADKAAKKSARAYKKLARAEHRGKDTTKLQAKYAKRKIKADKLASKANDSYEKQVKYDKKADEYLKRLDKENNQREYTEKISKAKKDGIYELNFIESIQNSKIYDEGNEKRILEEYDKYLKDRRKYMTKTSLRLAEA